MTDLLRFILGDPFALIGFGIVTLLATASAWTVLQAVADVVRAARRVR